LIAISTGGAWIFYFADAPTLLKDFITGQAHPVAYTTVAVLTATTYIFGGLMREQVCTYMCPWPRVQAAMLDEHSLVVTYNDWRGEPRSKHAKKVAADGVVALAIASTAMPALRCARWASTFATASSSNASPAHCASTPVTASWRSSAAKRA
jgi:polyferredoxin